MSNYVNYLVEMNLAMCVIFLLYILFLKKETVFSMRRLFIMIGLLFAIALPYVNIPSTLFSSSSFSDSLPSYSLKLIEVTGENNHDEFSAWNTSWKHLLFLGYGIISIYFLIVLCVQLIRIVIKIRTTPFYNYKALHIAESSEHNSCYSFFKYIFLSDSEVVSPEDKQFIIEHEAVHASQFHTIDKILLQFLSAICWFNPVVWFFKKEIVQLHEFEADARAVKKHDLNDYCSLLAKTTLLSADIPIANHFNTSLTVKRINMMKTHKTKLKGWKIAILFMIIPIVLIAFSCENKIDENEIILRPEFQAEYAEDGFNGLAIFLEKELKYPKEAKEQKIEGTVYVALTILKNGNTTNNEILKSPSELLNDEVLRIAKLTKWKPATVKGEPVITKVVLPVKFKLPE